jgi:hypothetical protein
MMAISKISLEPFEISIYFQVFAKMIDIVHSMHLSCNFLSSSSSTMVTNFDELDHEIFFF